MNDGANVLRLLLAALLSTAACGHYSSFTPTHKPPHPLSPRAPETVGLFTSGKPERPYVEVGVLGSGHDSAFSGSSELEIIGALRKQAADVGCDAVLVTDAQHNVFVVKGQSWTTTDFHALCIVYTDPAPSAAAGGQ